MYTEIVNLYLYYIQTLSYTWHIDTSYSLRIADLCKRLQYTEPESALY